MSAEYSRRSFVSSVLGSFGALSLGSTFASVASARPFIDYRALSSLGPLRSADANGIRLPQGFRSRLIAQSGSRVSLANGSKSAYSWHNAPDGGACFASGDGGWIYTSNSEIELGGGAGALRFDANGQLIDAYSILKGTRKNCAGGPTPWNTWLSCEEVSFGKVFECDVFGVQKARECPALGYFKHEAVAIDPNQNRVYLTEDESDGCFYRYTSEGGAPFDFTKGSLEVALVNAEGFVSWKAVPNPRPNLLQKPTRKQVEGAAIFKGGEGIWHHEGKILFTTKGDNRVWRYDSDTQAIEIIYDIETSPTPILSGVDNVTVSSDGHILVAEDGGDMQLVVLGPYGDVYPLVQIIGQDDSEITGPAFNPAHDGLYFSSQKGAGNGLTYELLGKFV